jgi:hypothetical protein
VYDPETSRLIRAIPSVAGIDPARLPEELTRVYTSIVALRTRVREQNDRSEELIQSLAMLRKLVNPFEIAVALNNQTYNVGSLAFVAAAAHHLLFLAEEVGLYPARPSDRLDVHTISPDISAVLLFIIAGYPSDAAEVGKKIRSRPGGIGASVTFAIGRLAVGDLFPILEINSDFMPEPGLPIMERAAYSLWYDILIAIQELARQLLGEPATEGPDWLSILRAVQAASVQSINIGGLGNDAGPLVFSLSGPHHLASLLVGAGTSLLQHAAIRVPTPPGLEGSEWTTFLRRLARQRPYLWSNHQEALRQGYLDANTSSVISFPTGAGKSILAELKIASTLHRGHKAVYLAPTHALVGQLARALKRTFDSEDVHDSLIGEGAFSEAEEPQLAKISVMTPERCLMLLSLYPEAFRDVGLLVFDECHLLHATGSMPERRSIDAMLCLLAMLEVSPKSEVVLLSAMIKNAVDLASWLASVLGEKCIALELQWKPTRQARGCLVFDTAEIEKLEAEIRMAKGKTKTPPAALQRKLKAKPYGFFCLQQLWESDDGANYSHVLLSDSQVALSAEPLQWRLTGNKNSVSSNLATSLARRGVKTLVFSQDHRFCTSIAESIVGSPGSQVPLRDDERRMLDASTEEMGDPTSVYYFPNGLAACHHGLMLPSERGLSEALFAREDGVNAIAATPTLAQGMNLPAQVVIIAGYDRFDEKSAGPEQMAAHEVLNAAGRAGRAGFHSQGLVLVIPTQVVRFAPATGEMGHEWWNLKRGIFSQNDHCLIVEDPVEKLLDAIHLADDPEERGLRYFLNRLPEDAAQLTAVLGKSLAAYHAKKGAATAAFEARVQRALETRQKLFPAPDGKVWISHLSRAMGYTPTVLQSCFAAIFEAYDGNRSVMSWVEWLLSWAMEDKERFFFFVSPARFEDAIPTKAGRGGPLRTYEEMASITKQCVALWMGGSPLNKIQAVLKPHDASGYCIDARKFAIRLIPDLSYIAGLPGLILRQSIISGDVTGKIPTRLLVLASCVREGFDLTEKLAMKVVRRNKYTRVGCHKLFFELSSRVELGGPAEEFASTIKRIRHVLDQDESTDVPG